MPELHPILQETETGMRIQTKHNEMIPALGIGSVASLKLSKAKCAIDQFIYSCSHTLRAPLKSISGLVNLLKNVERNSEMDSRLVLQSIEKTVEKMEVVLNELERFLSNSKQGLALQSVALRPLIRNVVTEIQTPAMKDLVSISIRVNQNVPFNTDECRLRVILTHLISNAVQFRDLSKSNMRVSVQAELSESRCILQVRDNGIGISSEVRPHIFELFYRGSERSTGSGVGLYIIHEIVNKMNGSILVRSVPGKGSVFQITLPNLTNLD